MTTHITKTWIEDGKLITEVIPEAEIYKREWVGLTDKEIYEAGLNARNTSMFVHFIEAKLKDKNA